MINRTYLSLRAKDLKPGMELVNIGTVTDVESRFHVGAELHVIRVLLIAKKPLFINHDLFFEAYDMVTIKKPGS